MEEILKLLSEISKNYSSDEVIFDDYNNFDMKDKTNFSENYHKISSYVEDRA